ncbi:hypothetical protein [Pelagicoccus sp. SDUM812005]|uniref:hypothetical protein n=1 Tax=Pelagicoccus sp. SDUM812005 TaxID=3041257 RepID=UPI00280E0D0D|nr:hypothetical protein [Pelagicoccus sp. SDUM812005]MDQ8181709.1 hypothetical protein [Pelagicoccus sp. SDUM812005]
MIVFSTFYIFGNEVGAAHGILGLVAIIAVAIAMRIVAGKWDRARIREELESSGCTFVSATWAPFGKGSFGEDSSRSYEVCYLNPDGERQYASVKTSLFTDVFWSGDGSPQRFGGRKPEPSPQAPILPNSEGTDCSNCGFFLELEHRFCPHCGAKKQ